MKVPATIKFVVPGQAAPVGRRQGPHPAHHRQDRRRRRALPGDGVHRRRHRAPWPWTAASPCPTWPSRPAARPASSRWTSTTRAYVEGRRQAPVHGVRERPRRRPTPRSSSIDVSQIEPQVAFPHLPSNARPLSQVGRRARSTRSVIGSCTNGPLEDLEAAADLLKGRKVHPRRALHRHPRPRRRSTCRRVREGLVEIFVEAGRGVSTPTCGPCLGGHMGILAAGRALRLDHQPQLRRPHGPPEERGLPRRARRGRGQRRARPHRRARRTGIGART